MKNQIIPTCQKATIWVLLATFAMLLSGCKTRMIDYTIISSKNVDISRISEFKRSPNRVSGIDEQVMILGIPTQGPPNVKEALDRAIESMPGAVALADGVIYQESSFFILGSSAGFEVEGTALIDPKAPGAKLSMTDTGFIVGKYDKGQNTYHFSSVDERTFNRIRTCVHGGDTRKLQEIANSLTL